MRLTLISSLVSLAVALPAPQAGVTPSTPSNVTTLPSPSSNSTSTPSPVSAGNSTDVGISLTNATIVSVPDYSTDNTTGIELGGMNAKDGTNYTLAAPFTPAGGDVQKSPQYLAKSNFDFQSLNLALNQELLELDLFHNGLATFSTEEFIAAGLTQSDIDLIKFMADQEVGHAAALEMAIGPDRAAKQCVYQYPYTTVEQFILFTQLVTRVGESGVLGFLPHLDSRPIAQVLLQAITTESRQQMILRQFQGLFPMPVWFETGITQSYAWTIQSNYIKSCPVNNPRIEWQNFPALSILNQPDVLSNFVPAISTNRSLTVEGMKIDLTWEAPGKKVGPDLNYTTSTKAGKPKYAAFISQLAVIYSPLFNVGNYSASVLQPNATILPGLPAVNGTMFVSLVDDNPYLTVYNLSLINDHTVAGPALYQSG